MCCPDPRTEASPRASGSVSRPLSYDATPFLVVFGRLERESDPGGLPAGGALRVPGNGMDGDGPDQGVQGEQSARHRFSRPGDDLDRLHGLPRPDDPRDRPQDPRFAAGRGIPAGGDLRDQAAQTGPRAGDDRRQLPAEPQDSRVHEGDPREDGGVAAQVFGREVVASVDHDIVLPEQRYGVLRGQGDPVLLQHDIGADCANGVPRRLPPPPPPPPAPRRGGAGDPRPPAPTTRAEAPKILSCPSGPISSIRMFRLYRRIIPSVSSMGILYRKIGRAS